MTHPRYEKIWAVPPVSQEQVAALRTVLAKFREDEKTWHQFSTERNWPYKPCLMDILGRIDQNNFGELDRRYYRPTVLEILDWGKTVLPPSPDRSFSKAVEEKDEDEKDEKDDKEQDDRWRKFNVTNSHIQSQPVSFQVSLLSAVALRLREAEDNEEALKRQLEADYQRQLKQLREAKDRKILQLQNDCGVLQLEKNFDFIGTTLSARTSGEGKARSEASTAEEEQDVKAYLDRLQSPFPEVVYCPLPDVALARSTLSCFGGTSTF